MPVDLRPAAASAAEYGRQLAAGQIPGHPTSIFYPPIALLTEIVLAVYKPGGQPAGDARAGSVVSLARMSRPANVSDEADRQGLPEGVSQHLDELATVAVRRRE